MLLRCVRNTITEYTQLVEYLAETNHRIATSITQHSAARGVPRTTNILFHTSKLPFNYLVTGPKKLQECFTVIRDKTSEKMADCEFSKMGNILHSCMSKGYQSTNLNFVACKFIKNVLNS